MHIAIDLDNTVLDATTAHITYYNRASGKALTAADIQDFYIYRSYGWNQEERDIIYAKHGHDIHWHSAPYPNAADSLRQLSLQHELSIITARPMLFRDVTIDWLNHHKFTYTNISFDENKLEACIAAKVDVLIDDAPHYAEEFARMRKPIILYDQPYNRAVTSEFVLRAANWVEVNRHIQHLATGLK
ncbi:5' nucleotidase, NT5C type [Paenibacillus lignilyticus]|uniref:Nucleotidase n=1 Tax=Paenibacillus lignilyticus TaxID=1172615 RepID=A0ABS5CFI7_9BACL|nr:hypothetical protein [Paenibacillus lignilyticus]MBP3964647.1 hypothetical protein [Paenibacillus lignilyticus]